MFKEYDVIQINRPMKNVPENWKGTILIIHENIDSCHYEVEFVNDLNQTLALLTVSENDIRLFNPSIWCY